MQTFKTNALFIGIFLFLAVALHPAPVLAEGGICIGLGGSHITMGSGDFEGTVLLTRQDPDSFRYQYIDLPKPKSTSLGFSARIGYEKNRWGLEVQYNRLSLDKEKTALFTEPRGTMDYDFFDFNCKYISHLFPVVMADIYLLAGINYTSLYFKQGEYLSDTQLVYKVDYSDESRISEASYAGIGYNLGVGVNYYVSSSVSIFAEYVYRKVNFGAVNDLEITDDVSTGGINTISMGVKYYIPSFIY